jgi:hypothetical protein
VRSARMHDANRTFEHTVLVTFTIGAMISDLLL